MATTQSAFSHQATAQIVDRGLSRENSFELASSQRWIVLASRPNLSEAISFAANLKEKFKTLTVYRSNNGWHAVVVGPVSHERASDIKNSLIKEGKAPHDAYLSRGERFVERVTLKKEEGDVNIALPLRQENTKRVAGTPMQLGENASSVQPASSKTEAGVDRTLAEINSSAVPQAEKRLFQSELASIAVAFLSDHDSHAVLMIDSSKSLIKPNRAAYQNNWNAQILLSCNKYKKSFSALATTKSDWKHMDSMLRVGMQPPMLHEIPIRWTRVGNGSVVYSGEISDDIPKFEFARFLLTLPKTTAVSFADFNNIAYYATEGQIRYLLRSCGIADAYDSGYDAQTAARKFGSNSSASSLVKTPDDATYLHWRGEMKQRMTNDPDISKVIYDDIFRSRGKPQPDTDSDGLYHNVRTECARGLPPSSISWRPLDQFLASEYPRWERVTASLSPSIAIKTHLYKGMVRCQNLMSPETLYSSLMEGKLLNTDIGNYDFSNSLIVGGAAFNDPVAQEVLMAATLHYGTRIGSSLSDTRIPTHSEAELNVSSSLAWALLASMNGSEVAEVFIKRYLFNRIDQESASHALKLIKDFARSRISIIEARSKRKGELQKLADGLFPKFDSPNFAGMEISIGSLFIVKAEDKFRTFFSNFDYSEATAAKDNLKLACTQLGRDLSGPASVVARIRQERWKECMSQYESFTLNYSEAIKRAIVDKGS